MLMLIGWPVFSACLKTSMASRSQTSCTRTGASVATRARERIWAARLRL